MRNVYDLYKEIPKFYQELKYLINEKAYRIEKINSISILHKLIYRSMTKIQQDYFQGEKTKIFSGSCEATKANIKYKITSKKQQ